MMDGHLCANTETYRFLEFCVTHYPGNRFTAHQAYEDYPYIEDGVTVNDFTRGILKLSANDLIIKKDVGRRNGNRVIIWGVSDAALAKMFGIKKRQQRKQRK